MMKNLIGLIKKKISKHKRVSVIALLLFLLIGGTVGYVLATNSSTNNNPKITQTNNQNKNPDTNVTGSKNAKKNDDKKNEVKEDKKSETKAEETNVSENTSNTSNNAVEETKNNNVSNNTSNSSYNNTSVQNTPAPCVPTYTTVNHPEVGHYETQVIRDAWDEPVYEMRIVGGHTGRIYNSLAEFDAQDEDGNYSIKQVQVDTIHHDAETQQVWVVDQQAWTETVASGC